MRIIGTCFMKNEQDGIMRQFWIMESWDVQNRIIIVAEEKLRCSEKTNEVIEKMREKDFLKELMEK